MSQHITIFGATSGIGQCAVEEALRRDHTVRAFARSAGDMTARPGLEPFPGDALDPGNVAEALRGTDAVIYALGIKESVSMLWKEVTLFRRPPASFWTPCRRRTSPASSPSPASARAAAGRP